MNDISNIKSNTNLYSQQVKETVRTQKDQPTDVAENNLTTNQNATQETKTEKTAESETKVSVTQNELAEKNEKTKKQKGLTDRDQIKKNLEKIIPEVQELMKKNQRSLEFDVAEEENRVIITVRDKATNQIIRQIPPEEFTSIAERLLSGDKQPNAGYFLDSKI